MNSATVEIVYNAFHPKKAASHQRLQKVSREIKQLVLGYISKGAYVLNLYELVNNYINKYLMRTIGFILQPFIL